MAEEREDQNFQDTSGKPATDQQAQPGQFAEQGQQSQGQDAKQPISGENQFGSGQTTGQEPDSAQASGQTPLGGTTETLTPEETTGESGGFGQDKANQGSGEGFIGSQGPGNDELVQDKQPDTTDFAADGQGATDDADKNAGTTGGGV